MTKKKTTKIAPVASCWEKAIEDRKKPGHFGATDMKDILPCKLENVTDITCDPQSFDYELSKGKIWCTFKGKDKHENESYLELAGINEITTTGKATSGEWRDYYTFPQSVGFRGELFRLHFKPGTVSCYPPRSAEGYQNITCKVDDPIGKA